jgi:2-dehydro-3-deoxyphosphogluconate aldolase / (4S)-4-hydroxy-2-oxoglutarate aldolase
MSPWFNTLRHCPIIAIVRSLRRDWGYQMAVTAIEAGLSCIEIGWGKEEVTLDLIQRLRADFPQCSIGVGTIFSQQQLTAAIEVGCQFAFSPVLDLGVLRLAQAADLPFVPGALTPTEIWTAWQAGAMAVKVFPIKGMGGSPYLRCLREALGTAIPLIPTGGVTPEQTGELLRAGATAVGLSGGLFPRLSEGEPDLRETHRIASQLLLTPDGSDIKQRVDSSLQNIGDLEARDKSP